MHLPRHYAIAGMVFGPDAVTSGAKADLQYTTRVAREMVYKLGMGPGTGLVAFDDREGGGAVSGELHAAMDRDVRGIGRSDLRALFPECAIQARRETLAPPISRHVARVSWPLASALEALPFLRSHLIASIRTPS